MGDECGHLDRRKQLAHVDRIEGLDQPRCRGPRAGESLEPGDLLALLRVGDAEAGGHDARPPLLFDDAPARVLRLPRNPHGHSGLHTIRGGVAFSTSALTRSGCVTASTIATAPPSATPSTVARSDPAASMTGSRRRPDPRAKAGIGRETLRKTGAALVEPDEPRVTCSRGPSSAGSVRTPIRPR